MLIKIILLPFKLAVKIISFILMVIAKMVGILFRFIGAVLLIPLELFGGLCGIAGIVLIIMSIYNPELREYAVTMQELGFDWVRWWMPGLASIVIGALIAYFPNISEAVGDFVIEKGEDIWFAASMIDFF